MLAITFERCDGTFWADDVLVLYYHFGWQFNAHEAESKFENAAYIGTDYLLARRHYCARLLVADEQRQKHASATAAISRAMRRLKERGLFAATLDVYSNPVLTQRGVEVAADLFRARYVDLLERDESLRRNFSLAKKLNLERVTLGYEHRVMSTSPHLLVLCGIAPTFVHTSSHRIKTLCPQSPRVES